MEVKNIIQTCPACPSQWEGHLKDGRMFYARYRWGALTIQVSKEPTGDVMDAVMGEMVYNEILGGGYDGTLEQNELEAKMKACGFFICF